MKNLIIKPTGRKGLKVLDRMKELMEIAPIKKNVARSVVELTKLGPDNKVYGIVKENMKYFIKVSDKIKNLIPEDFKYIGGLMNKMSESYPSYSQATKQLNLKLLSIAESLDAERVLNILRSDNLMEGEDINGEKAPEDKKTSGDNLADGDNIGVDDFEKAKADGTKDGDQGEHAEEYVMEDVEMTENEIAIDEMIRGKKAPVKENTISIARAMDKMDIIIEEVTGKSEKIDGFLSTLSESEMKILVKNLKKINEDENYGHEGKCSKEHPDMSHDEWLKKKVK